MARGVRGRLVMQTRHNDIRPEIPEDVRAEMDIEARRLGVAPAPGTPGNLVPEDVLSDLDHEQRQATEKVVGALNEGGPPLDEEADT